MTNFICQLGWFGVPGMQSNIILDFSVKVFWEWSWDLYWWIISKADYSLQYREPLIIKIMSYYKKIWTPFPPPGQELQGSRNSLQQNSGFIITQSIIIAQTNSSSYPGLLLPFLLSFLPSPLSLTLIIIPFRFLMCVGNAVPIHTYIYAPQCLLLWRALTHLSIPFFWVSSNTCAQTQTLQILLPWDLLHSLDIFFPWQYLHINCEAAIKHSVLLLVVSVLDKC